MKRPPPIRTDEGNAFAHYSMRERVPRIARDVVEHAAPGALPAAVRDDVERLACDIEQGRPLPSPRPPGPGLEAWESACRENAGASWLAAPWFFAELYFYRELMDACRFWETSRDPFEPTKDEELAGERPWEHLAAAVAERGAEEARISAVLGHMLWGNRVDLSYAVGLAHGAALAGDLLIDDRARVTPILARRGSRTHIVVDNAGTELVLDLALAALLLEDPSRAVTLHLKVQPVFVSDATARDVWRTFARMHDRGGDVSALAERLLAAFDEGRMRFAPDLFWSGPRFLWDMPDYLRASFASADIVVVKGDANYRRVVGDAIWPASESFAHVSSYSRVPIVCVRTMKSDALVGLDEATLARLDAEDAKWRINGRRGLIQASVP